MHNMMRAAGVDYDEEDIVRATDRPLPSPSSVARDVDESQEASLGAQRTAAKEARDALADNILQVFGPGFHSPGVNLYIHNIDDLWFSDLVLFSVFTLQIAVHNIVCALPDSTASQSVITTIRRTGKAVSRWALPWTQRPQNSRLWHS